jgi:hypothetical protein
MKRQIKVLLFILLLFTLSYPVSAQEKITIVTPNKEIAESLDLNAVVELFKDSQNLQEFENALNDPDIGINNLDLDGDGYVDYIQVVEQVTDDTHVIILQVPLGNNQFQEIASIEIEKTGYDSYNMRVHGNEAFYGVNFYISPGYVGIYHWPIIAWIYRPFYHPYRSIFYFGYYPRWWKPYRVVTIPVYHSRTSRYDRRSAFYENRIRRTPTVHERNYERHSDYRWEKKMDRSYREPEHDRSNRYVNPPARREERGSMDSRERTLNNRTIRGEKNSSFKPGHRQDTPFKRELRNPTRPERNKNSIMERRANQSSRQNVEKRSDVNKGDRKTTVKRKNRSSE